MKLTVTMFMTFDGVVQAPGGPDEDRSGGFERGGWLVPYADDDMGKLVTQWFAEADAFLLGRRTWQIFAAHWPRVPDDNAVARALNARPKHVASTTLRALDWRGSTLLDGDLATAVRALKAQPGRELQVHGSPTLVRSLVAHGLVDEYRFWTYPVALGCGRRLFEDPSTATALTLVDTKLTSTGVVVSTYRPDGPPRQGSFALDPEPAQHRILR